MFVNSLTETCIKLSKQVQDDGYNYGSWVADKEIAFLFVEQTGEVVNDSAGNETVIDGVGFTEEEITNSNRLAYSGYEYEIVSVKELRDPLTTQVYGYRCHIKRRKEYNEEPVEIS